MINVIDDHETIVVEFIDNSNECVSGKLLTYEIYGEACVLVGAEKAWVPFSHLTEESQNQILKTGVKVKNETKNIILREPKVLIIITLLVLYSYFCFL